MGQKREIRVFIVDDDPLFLEALYHYLTEDKTKGLIIKKFSTGEACLLEMEQKPEIVVLDYYLNSLVPEAINGIEILKKIKAAYPDSLVIVLSSQDSVETAVKILENGAFEYVSKNESAFLRIENIIKNIYLHKQDINSIHKKIAFGKTVNIALLVLIILLIILSRLL